MMRDLIDSSLSKELDRIIQRPLKVITDYSAIPELSSRISFSHLRSEKIPEYFYYDITDKAKKVSFTTEWTEYTPEPYIYELKDVFILNGLVVTQRGEILCDSLLEFSQKGIAFELLNRINDIYCIIKKFSENRSTFKEYNTGISICSQNEFGHYIIESLCQLWLCNYIEVENIIISPQRGRVVKYGLSQVPSFLYDMLLPFNFTKDSIKIAPFCFVHRLYLPSKMSMYKQFFSSVIHSAYKKIALYYTNNTKKIYNIYVSRSKTTNRKMINEVECENFFQEHSFTCVYPETMSFADQVTLFTHATHVAGPVGSALHNVLFSLEPEQLKLLMLAPSKYNAWIHSYGTIERSYGRIPYFIFGSHCQKPKNNYDLRTLPWSISLDTVKKGFNHWLGWQNILKK